MSDHHRNDDELDPHIEEFFAQIEQIPAPDNWTAIRDRDAITIDAVPLTRSRRVAPLLAAAAVLLTVGAFAVRGLTSSGQVDVADTVGANETIPPDEPPDPGDPNDNTSPTIPIEEDDERSEEAVGHPTSAIDNVVYYRWPTEDGSQFRIVLPQRLVNDLVEVKQPGRSTVLVDGPDLAFELFYGFCPEEERGRMNSQGSVIYEVPDDSLWVCRSDDVLALRLENRSGRKLTEDEVQTLDIRPLAMGGAYAKAFANVWPQYTGCGNCIPWGPHALPEAGVIVSRSGESSISAIDMDILTERWRFETEGFAALLHGGPDDVYLEEVGGPFYRLDAQDGTEVWRIERDEGENYLGFHGFGSDVSLVSTSFVSEGDDRAPILRRVNVDTGEVLWTARGREGTDFQFTRPVVLDGFAIFMDLPNNPGTPLETPGQMVHAFDINSGALLWSTDLGSPSESFDIELLAIFENENGPALIARTIEGDVLRVAPTDGEIIWRTTVGAFARFGGTDFAGEDGRLAIEMTVPGGRRLLDFDTGEELEEADIPFVCPVDVPNPTFIPPEPWAPTPLSSELRWFGTADLWTVLPFNAVREVWWSANFPGGAEEERPEISVIYEQLDGTGSYESRAPGTNAYTAPDGDFMFSSGPKPSEPGCWRAIASYKGASLSVIWEQ